MEQPQGNVRAKGASERTEVHSNCQKTTQQWLHVLPGTWGTAANVLGDQEFRMLGNLSAS